MCRYFPTKSPHTISVIYKERGSQMGKQASCPELSKSSETSKGTTRGISMARRRKGVRSCQQACLKAPDRMNQMGRTCTIAHSACPTSSRCPPLHTTHNTGDGVMPHSSLNPGMEVAEGRGRTGHCPDGTALPRHPTQPTLAHMPCPFCATTMGSPSLCWSPAFAPSSVASLCPDAASVLYLRP